MPDSIIPPQVETAIAEFLRGWKCPRCGFHREGAKHGQIVVTLNAKDEQVAGFDLRMTGKCGKEEPMR